MFFMDNKPVKPLKKGISWILGYIGLYWVLLGNIGVCLVLKISTKTQNNLVSTLRIILTGFMICLESPRLNYLSIFQCPFVLKDPEN
jgi:hypothetical protein